MRTTLNTNRLATTAKMHSTAQFNAWLSTVITETLFNWQQVQAAMRPAPNANFAAQLPTNWRAANAYTAPAAPALYANHH